MRQGDQELRLAAGLEPEAPGGTELDDLLDDVPLLVDLHREDAPVAARVVVLGDRLGEALVEPANAVAQDVREANEEREGQAAGLEIVNQGEEVDAATLARWIGSDLDVAFPVHAEVRFAPAPDLIELGAFLDGPRGRSLLAGKRGRRSLGCGVRV